MKVGSLFAGIGGFDLGFERAGYEIVWQVEIDDYCRRVLEKHFPKARRFTDVRDIYRFAHEYPACECCGEEPWCERHGMHFGECACIGCSEWDDEIYPVDIIVGGDPCQRNSSAWRHGTGEASPAGEFIRIVDVLRPGIVLRENPSAVRADAPWPWWKFRAELERIGYAVLPFRLRACCFGADHERERLFLLGTLPDANGAGLERYEREVMERAGGRGYNTNFTGSNRWSAAPRICGRTDGIPNRMDRLEALGNAIVPQIAQWIAERIKEAQ